MPSSRKVKVIKHIISTPVKPEAEMVMPTSSFDKKTTREITRQVNAWVADIRERKMPHPSVAAQRPVK